MKNTTNTTTNTSTLSPAQRAVITRRNNALAAVRSERALRAAATRRQNQVNRVVSATN